MINTGDAIFDAIVNILTPLAEFVGPGNKTVNPICTLIWFFATVVQLGFVVYLPFYFIIKIFCWIGKVSFN